MIGVPIPSARTVSISFQPSRPGQHQVEDAGIRLLVAEPREPLVAVTDPDRVEAGRAEMARHALRDHLVVLDDQHLRHLVSLSSRGVSPAGRWKVNGW